MIQVAYRKVSSLLVAATTIMLVGCASFQGGELPERSLADLSTPTSKSTASVRFGWQINGKDNQTVGELISPEFTSVLDESNLFSRVSEGGQSADYHFEVSVNNTGNRFLATLSGLITGLTLFAIPGYARDNYNMHVSVSKEGVQIKELDYEDHITTILQWVMIVFAPGHSIGDAPKKLIKNMTWNLLYDLQQENILPSN